MSLTQLALDEATLARVDAAAVIQSTSRDDIINQAINSYLLALDQKNIGYDAWFCAKIERGVQAANAGDLLTNQEIDERAEARINFFREKMKTVS